jgi:hypothetical protein
LKFLIRPKAVEKWIVDRIVSGQSLGEEGREQAAHQSGALNALSFITVHREGIYRALLSVLQGISKLLLSMLHFLLSMLHSYISMPQVKLYVHEDILSKITPFSLGYPKICTARRNNNMYGPTQRREKKR